MNTNAVKAQMVLHGDTYEDLAKAIGITGRSLQSKVGGNVQFKLNELVAIKNRYSLTPEQFNEIFFN